MNSEIVNTYSSYECFGHDYVFFGEVRGGGGVLPKPKGESSCPFVGFSYFYAVLWVLIEFRGFFSKL